MTKPEDIPHWAWKKAEGYFEWLTECWPSTALKLPDVTKERLARAILSAVEEEREACAKACDAQQIAGPWQGTNAGTYFASLIRSRKEA